MKRICYCNIILLGLFLWSCSGNNKPIYFDSSLADITNESYSDFIEVPYREDAGVKIISVKINGVGHDMIFDSGCSLTLISIAEAKYQYDKGLLSDDDILGVTQSMIADGSIVENMVINLKEVKINDQLVFNNVTATVSSQALAPLLLGNEILDQVGSYTIDNNDKVIRFKRY